MSQPYYVKGLIGKVLAMADNLSANILRGEQEYMKQQPGKGLLSLLV